MIDMVPGQGRSETLPTTGELKGELRPSAPALYDLLSQQEFKCGLTGEALTPENATLDHITPRKNGGDSSISNLQWVTKQANGAKGTMAQDEFIEICQRVVERHPPHGD